MLLKVVIAIPFDHFSDDNFHFVDMNDTYDQNVVNVFFASLGHVLDDHAVLDTGSDDMLNKFCQKFDLQMTSEPSNVQFKGVNDSVPIRAESEQAIPVGIAGKACTLRFQRLNIISGQLNDLDGSGMSYQGHLRVEAFPAHGAQVTRLLALCLARSGRQLLEPPVIQRTSTAAAKRLGQRCLIFHGLEE